MEAARPKKVWRSPAVKTRLTPPAWLVVALLGACEAEAQYPHPRLKLQPNLTRSAGFVLRDSFNFGPAASGPGYAKPSFASNTDAGYPLAYLVYANSDCTGTCLEDTADHTGKACASGVWHGGTGATCQQLWTGDYAWTDITDAKAWYVDGITQSYTQLFERDFTVCAFGYHTTKESATPMLAEVYEGAALDGLWMRGNGSSTNITWFETTAFPQQNSVQNTYNGFNLICAHRTGHTRNVNVNGGSENTANSAALGTVAQTGTLTFMLGRADPLTNGQANGGQLGWLGIYSSDYTAAQSGTVATTYAGVPSGATANGTGTTLCFDRTDAGQAHCMGNAFPYIDERGYRTWSGERTTSKWAADPLDVSSWTAVNTPGVVTNAKAGPFFELLHSNEMDRIIDTDGSHFSGYKSNASSFLRAPMNYTTSCYLSAGDGGTSNKARLTLEVAHGLFADGGTEADCDLTVTTTPLLYSCTAPLMTYDGGVDLRGGVYVGNAAGDTGSLTVGHCRLNAGVAAEPATLSNASVGDSYVSASIGLWHSDSAGGEHELVWMPLSTAGAFSSTTSLYPDWQEQADAIYPHDAYDNSNNHISTFIRGYNTSGHGLFRFQSVVNSTLVDLTQDGIHLLPGTIYATAAKWLGSGTCVLSALENTCVDVASCHATTAVITGSGGCPDHPTQLKLGQRFDNSVPTDMWLLSMRHMTP